MAHRKILEGKSIDPSDLDLSTWPGVLLDTLTAKDRETFLSRKRAIEMYMSPHFTLDQITRETGVSRNRLIDFVKRCLSEDSNGVLWGYRALIPQKKLKSYTRTNLSSKSEKLTGIFNHFLSKHPHIKELIHDQYLTTKQGRATDPVKKPKHIHVTFLNACRSLGLSMKDYPFSTRDLGRRSLYRYLKKLEQNLPNQAANRYGDEAARHIRHTGIGHKNADHILKPFQRVEFDGHQIDLILTIKFRNQFGDECVDVLERIWLLVIIDVATRVVIGYHICLQSQYSASDVLACIRNAIVPTSPKKLTIPGLNYPTKGGFHFEAIPQTQWALWSEFCYDNGKANLAKIVTNRLANVVGCAMNPGPVNMPERRPFVERFFGLLEENGYHRFVNTTGSHPTDPRRTHPEKMAIKYEMDVEELEQITAVLIANYNHEPHSSLGYLSPLEVMEQRVVHRGMEPRWLPEELRKEVEFFGVPAIRTVRGNIKQGKRPYITFEGVEYRNELLSNTFDLIGEEIYLLVNTNDIRYLKAFLKDGGELGYITATGRWGITPHTLQMRKQINALQRNKLLHYANNVDPIEALNKYYEEKATNNKKVRNSLATHQRYIKQMESQVPEQKKDMSETKPSEHAKPINHDRQSKQSNKGGSQASDLSKLREKFKTINL
ncbi:hypothetical protein [Brevibacillus sp. Leaf182]|uniref:hypothetical protein n=1 Tax=Brevibacillus sp. Leaf182 TaxID=1736290 RepID=UPI0006F62B89|nr:hypothetical protein [Brevibacillus sp. Leaf182]RAT94015.1 hypothetical protein ASG16_027950 [Brevibacillus sp. Leaf182]